MRPGSRGMIEVFCEMTKLGLDGGAKWWNESTPLLTWSVCKYPTSFSWLFSCTCTCMHGMNGMLSSVSPRRRRIFEC
jgi:hypothetical protein